MKTVRILLNIGTQDQVRLQLDSLYREREIVELDDDKADILISEGKAWDMSSQKERDNEAARHADIRSAALAAAERKAAQEAADKEATEAVAKAHAAAEKAPRGPATPTPEARPVSSRELGTEIHDRPLAQGGKKDKV